MKILDADHPFFAPVWRRWATVLFAGFWGLMELFLGNPGWAVLFGAASAYSFYVLIYQGPSSGPNP
jgi:hypothetical protein